MLAWGSRRELVQTPPSLPFIRHQYDVHRVSSSLLGPADPSFRALSGRLKFTVRRHRCNKDSPSSPPVEANQTKRGQWFRDSRFEDRGQGWAPFEGARNDELPTKVNVGPLYKTILKVPVDTSRGRDCGRIGRWGAGFSPGRAPPYPATDFLPPAPECGGRLTPASLLLARLELSDTKVYEP